MIKKIYNSVLCVVAHPDDCEICAFGTLLRFAKAGSNISIIIMTGGERGVEVTSSNSELADRVSSGARKKEAESALSAFDSVEWFDMIDGHIAVDGTTISKVDSALKKHNPDLLVTHPYRPLFDHQDHVAVSQVVQNAWQRLPKQCDLWCFEPIVSSRCDWNPNLLIDVTSYFPAKLEAMKHHESQKGREYLTAQWHKQRSDANQRQLCPFSRDDNLLEAFEACLII